MGNIGVYIHIPFCKSKCDYCDFYSLANREESMSDYQAALISHIRETAVFMRSSVVDTIYFGGGTPTFFGEKRLISVLRELKKSFTVAADAELTLEANPDSVTFKSLRKLRRAGFNRISIGMQSAIDSELRDISRAHTFSEASAAFDHARAAGFTNISLDLIYGLPGQTPESFSESLASAIAMSPEHISCYGLKLEEGTPLYLKQDSLSLPDDDTAAEMYLFAVRALSEAGYEQYEISNFSKPGNHSRHNMKYWNSEEYIGFGASAHSDLGERRYSFIKDLDKYIAHMKTSGSVVDEFEDIPRRERAGEYLMLRLRTSKGINAKEYSYRFRIPFDPLAQRLSEYAEMGLAENSGEDWRLTPKGFLLSNRVIGDIIDCQSEKRLTFADFTKNANR